MSRTALARYILTTRRDVRGASGIPTALDAARQEPGVQVLAASDPQMVTIETSSEIADELRQKLAKTHFVEPEVRRGLNEA